MLVMARLRQGYPILFWMPAIAAKEQASLPSWLCGGKVAAAAPISITWRRLQFRSRLDVLLRAPYCSTRRSLARGSPAIQNAVNNGSATCKGPDK